MVLPRQGLPASEGKGWCLVTHGQPSFRLTTCDSPSGTYSEVFTSSQTIALSKEGHACSKWRCAPLMAPVQARGEA